MNKLALLVFLILSTQAFASSITSNSVTYTIAEAIYSFVAVPVASSGATTVSSKAKQKEAVEIKVDILEYYQSGVTSIALKNQIKIVHDIDSSLSLEEALDALMDAAGLVLNT